MNQRDSLLQIETSVDLEHEAKLILLKKELTINADQKQRLILDFRNFLRLQRLLGNYALRTAFVGILLVITAIILLVLLIKNTPAWAYILYGIVGGIVITGFVLLGVAIRKGRQLRKRRTVAAYIMARLAAWTKERLREERQLNRKRFLFENLMSALFDYIKFDPNSSQENLEAHDLITEIVNDWHNIDIIVLITLLFKNVFKTDDKKYDERGFLILMKILSPILNYSTNDELSNLVHNLVSEFIRETKVNFYTSQIKMIALSPTENILLVRSDLANFDIEFELFEDNWKTPLEYKLNRSMIPGAKDNGRSKLNEDGSQSFQSQGLGVNNLKTNATLHPKLPPPVDFPQTPAEKPHEENYSETGPGEQPEPAPRRTPPLNNLREEEPSVLFVLQPEAPQNEFTPTTTPYKDNEPQDKPSFKESALQGSNANISQLHIRRSLTLITQIKIPESMRESSVIHDDAVRQLLSIVEEPEANFKQVIKNTKMTILKRTEEGNPVVLIKSFSTVEGSAEKIFTLIFDLNYRSKWDKVFTNLKITKILNENTDVMYSFLKAPLFVTDRDFLQRRTCYKNFKGNDYLIAFKSWEDAELPPLKGIIRANTVISGYVIRALGPDKCHLTIVSQTDIKGSIPKSIINAVAAKSPLDWIKRLEQALNLFK